MTKIRIGFDRHGSEIHRLTSRLEFDADDAPVFDVIAQCSRRSATVTAEVDDSDLLTHLTCERCRQMTRKARR